MVQQQRLNIETARLRVHCRISGDSDGVPLVLLHGSYGTGRWWEQFMAALPAEILAIAPDQRGCGQSDKPEAGYEVASLAADVAALVDALDLADFHLMAHSNAGAVAMEYVFTHPERAATLTLVDTAPVEGVFTPIDTYLLLEEMKTDRQLLTEAMTLLAPSLWRTPEVSPANRRLLDELVDDAQQMAPAAFTEIARGLAQWNRFADARQLTLPTLLVGG
ncbi:MAG: alpha/beta hydrolase [Anaerolineales bacterium]|nr:alpha/beta hydrolase [Anaerolineales bacterium]